MKLYAVMWEETDGYEYSCNLCLGVYDSEDKAQEKIDRNVDHARKVYLDHRMEIPRYNGARPEEYSILPFTLNGDW